MTKVSVRCPSCNVGLKVKVSEPDQSITCPQCQHRGPVAGFPEIQRIRKTCPSCKGVLAIDPMISGAITCPKCKYKGSLDAMTDDPDKTRYPTKADKQQYKPGILMIAEGDCLPAKIELERGINTLGRKSSNTTCSIPLATEDRYLSRNHFAIEVILKPDYTFEHLLSDAGSNNGTYHNGEKLSKDEVAVLMPHDTVTAGRTTFEFIIE